GWDDLLSSDLPIFHIIELKLFGMSEMLKDLSVVVEILLQGKTGKGMPYIMAILDDIITGLTGVEQKSEPTENE
ncbi:MAG: hypothetical protein IJI08_07640, partial [Clostridia bacterium]|nr:hypothetical protein [Clostridia bacterium]